MGGGFFQGDGDSDDGYGADGDDDEEIDFPKQFRGRLTVFIDPHSAHRSRTINIFPNWWIFIDFEHPAKVGEEEMFICDSMCDDGEPFPNFSASVFARIRLSHLQHSKVLGFHDP